MSGGRFSYGWLEDVELRDMKIVCDPSGKVTIQEAYVALGDGMFKFKAEFDIKAQPKVEGVYEFQHWDVLDFIGSKYEPWLEGRVQGVGTFSGSMNSADGITYNTTITLAAGEKEATEENDSFILIKGDKFPVLEVIQSVDLLNSYSKIRAHTGQVIFKHQDLKGHSEITLDSVRCGPDGIILMNGSFECLTNDDIPASVEEASSKGKVFDGEIVMGFLPIVFQGHLSLIDAFKVDEVVLRTQLSADIKGSIHQLTSKIAEELEEAVRETKK